MSADNCVSIETAEWESVNNSLSDPVVISEELQAIDKDVLSEELPAIDKEVKNIPYTTSDTSDEEFEEEKIYHSNRFLTEPKELEQTECGNIRC